MPLTRDQIVGDDDERMAFKFTMLNDGKVVQLATLERHVYPTLGGLPINDIRRSGRTGKG